MKICQAKRWLLIIAALLTLKVVLTMVSLPLTGPALVNKLKSLPDIREVAAQQENAAIPGEKAEKKSNEDQSTIWLSLKKKEQDIKLKEEILLEEEKRIQGLKREIEERIVQLKKLQENIEQILVKQKAVDEERMSRLVKFYEAMEAEEAAPLVNRLEEGVATELFVRMNEKKAGKILAQMDAEKAIKVSERLAMRHQKAKSEDYVE